MVTVLHRSRLKLVRPIAAGVAMLPRQHAIVEVSQHRSRKSGRIIGATSCPVIPSSSSSVLPPTRVAITGSAQAIASGTVFEMPSPRDGSTKQSSPRHDRWQYHCARQQTTQFTRTATLRECARTRARSAPSPTTTAATDLAPPDTRARPAQIRAPVCTDPSRDPFDPRCPPANVRDCEMDNPRCCTLRPPGMEPIRIDSVIKLHDRYPPYPPGHASSARDLRHSHIT